MGEHMSVSMEKLETAMGIVLAETMEPDDINAVVDDGLEKFAERFQFFGVTWQEVDVALKFFLAAQSYNGSRGYFDNDCKYARI